MTTMHFNRWFDLIDNEIPGQQLWMQCIPVWDDDKPTEECVGLAIFALYPKTRQPTNQDASFQNAVKAPKTGGSKPATRILTLR